MNDFLSGPHVLVEAESLLVLRLLLPPPKEKTVLALTMGLDFHSTSDGEFLVWE